MHEIKNTWSIDDLQDTWELATLLHQGQTYGGQNPGEKIAYINHIGSVAFEVMAALAHTPGMNAQLALTCALLHDSIEDTSMTLEGLKERYGNAVADGVMALTKNTALGSKDAQMQDSLQRIRQQPHEIWAVKLADRICNLYAPPFYWNDQKKMKYIREAQYIHETLREGNAYLAARLAEKITRYHRFLDTE